MPVPTDSPRSRSVTVAERASDVLPSPLVGPVQAVVVPSCVMVRPPRRIWSPGTRVVRSPMSYTPGASVAAPARPALYESWNVRVQVVGQPPELLVKLKFEDTVPTSWNVLPPDGRSENVATELWRAVGQTDVASLTHVYEP